MRKHTLLIILVLWIIGILFPMAFLGRMMPALGSIFDLLFTPPWMHLFMHGLLYAVLGFLLTLLVRSTTCGSAVLILGCCLAVGVLHESLQLLTAHAFPGIGPEMLDLGVDLLGSFLGVCLGKLVRRRMALKVTGQEPGEPSI